MSLAVAESFLVRLRYRNRLHVCSSGAIMGSGIRVMLAEWMGPELLEPSQMNRMLQAQADEPSCALSALGRCAIDPGEE